MSILLKRQMLDQELGTAVSRVLHTAQFPIYERQGDGGLDEDEYEAFALAVIRELESLSSRPPPPRT